MFRFKVFFEMQYNTAYGEFLVVVGNTKDLGQWNVAKGVRLDWTHVNFFKRIKNLKTIGKYLARSDRILPQMPRKLRI